MSTWTRCTTLMSLVFGIAFVGSSARADPADLSVLQWNPDPNMRLPHVDGHMIVTCVRQTGPNSWGMYYLNNALTYSNTGYADSNDGMAWTNLGIVMDNTGVGFDQNGAVIYDVVALPNGHLRAYCAGWTSDGPVSPWTARIFVADSNDGGISWGDPNDRHVIIDVEPNTPTAGGALAPEVIQRDGQYIMFFEGRPTGSGPTNVVKATSADGLNWAISGVVLEYPSEGDFTGGWDIAETPDGNMRMFLPARLAGETGYSIHSLISSDEGDTWAWDPNSRLTPDQFGVSRLSSCALVDIDGTAKMFVSGGPGDPYDDVYSATGVPEPATLLLLALGGLAVMRRRRK